MTESRHATNVTSLRGHARTVLTVPDDMRTLPAIHDAQAGEFAEKLLANQRQFADEMIDAAAPILPGRSGKAAK